MKVEYLVTIEIKDSFCKTKKAFINFIQSNADILLIKEKVTYKNNSFNLEILEEKSPSERHKIFHLKVKSGHEGEIESFVEFLKVLRGMLHIASKNNIQTIWDDISYNYSLKCYPIIHEIENLMRKLITKFMLTNVGLGWIETTFPEELLKAKRDRSTSGNNNYLYETDFIQLSNFLFDSYRTQDIDELILTIKNHKDDSIKIENIKEFIPLSNWQRYFQKHVDCEATYLKARWEKLYLLRCKIAHNNIFDKNDYDLIITLNNEVKPILEKAISSLDKITVSESEREELAENVAINNNQYYGDFIVSWKLFEKRVMDLAYKSNIAPDNKVMPLSPLILRLRERSLISEDFVEQFLRLREIRNIVVHDLNREITIHDLEYYTMLLKGLTNMV
ncbi:HEPN domain-containing protein [Enterobacteriaceae bacterium H4N4]|uniref:HEPN domain-containing protein n=1 Tax=Silvania confinis TaxID=2926470 RepID=A0A9J6Q9C5_9ENTR|nr:HEPN domain-containing protein [Silvania confinis]MCU6668336.1 HEPN domain-containing protein [Silvania confinis]